MKRFGILCFLISFIQLAYGGGYNEGNINAHIYNDVTKNIVIQVGKTEILDPLTDLGVKTNDGVGGCKSSSYSVQDKTAFSVEVKKRKWYDKYDLYYVTPLKAGHYIFYGKVTYLGARRSVTDPYTHKTHVIDFDGTSTVTYNITVIDVTSISIPSSLSLKTGDDYTFYPVISDSRVKTTLNWSSNKPSVVSVQDGTIRALSAGTAYITCTAPNGVSAVCAVTVSDVPVSQIVLPSTALELTKGSTYKLTPTIIPSNATDQTMTWSTSDPNVATVSNEAAKYIITPMAVRILPILERPASAGTITAVGVGTATITGYANDGSGKTVTCQVTVIRNPDEVLIQRIDLSGGRFQTLHPGQTYQLTATTLPENASDKSVSWSTSNNGVVSVSNTGLVEAGGTGQATVTCTANDGSGTTATCVFRVEPIYVSEMVMSTTACTLEAGKTQQLSVTVLPENATDKLRVWSCADFSVAKVSYNGLVTAISPGVATVTCKALDGSGVVGTCVVTVTPVMVKSITLNTTSCELHGGETMQLSANVQPADAADKSVSWSSSDFNVASIDENGLVTAHSSGEATVTCTALDGSGTYSTCKVIVNSIPVTDITLNHSSYTIGTTNTVQLTATVTPTDATVSSVTWSSSNNNVASVDENGLVTAQGKGKAIISCISDDNSEAYASCEVTVYAVYSQSLTLEDAIDTMDKGDKLQLKPIYSPANTTYYSITWKSSNTSVATVDSYGLVTAVGSGQAIITCIMNMSFPDYFLDPYEKRASHTITVNSDVTEAVIPFKDIEVKRICVENWDTNGDGELSYAEAAAVTDLGDVFRSNRDIESFSELQYFTGLTSIGNSAFSLCYNLSDIVLPPNVEIIEGAAFWTCRKLTTIEIPAKVRSIGAAALSGCSDRSSIKVASGNSTFDSRDGCNAIIETATNKLIHGCSTTAIPNEVVGIRSAAFHECKGLKSIVIGKNVTEIEEGAFLDCEDVETIIVDAQNPVYDSREGCNAIIKTSSNELLVGCRNTIIPEGVVAICPQAFRCQHALNSIYIPESVKTVDWQAFNASGLTEIVLPDGLTTIGSDAFTSCTNLTRVELPGTLTTIGSNAFSSSNNLTTFIVNSENPLPVASNSLPTNRDEVILYVPTGSIDAYKAADYWKDFKEIIEMGSINGPTSYATTIVSQLSDAIYAKSIRCSESGGLATLTISMKNASATNAYSFDLVLPDGVTLATDAQGDYLYEMSNRHDGHTASLNYRVVTGVYSFVVLSLQSKEVKDNDGVILTLKLNVPANMTAGKYAIKIRNAKYSLVSGYASVAMAEATSTLTIDGIGSNFIKGDVNDDGEVDIADAVCVVNYVVGKPTPAFNAAAADANDDGDVDIADAVRIVNLVVGKIQALARQRQTSLPEPE